jgi:fatty-acyl-CoA synthase
MKGYYKMPEETDRAIDKDGWLHTGDLAVMDENGYCKITGRIKNMIIRGGENVYPREIEEFLYTHPKVSDVQVYGVPDRKYGEQVMAAVKLKDGVSCSEEEIRDFCKGRIANYKTPRYVKFVDEYPMTASGKIQKFKLREMAIRELQLEEAAGVETA